MKILYVHGNSVIKAIAEAMERAGYEVEIYPKKEAGVFIEEEIVEEITDYIKRRGITHIVSLHLISNLAMAARQTGVKYLSIIWDAPYYKIYSSFGYMENCYFSVFDKTDYQRFVRDGIPHVVYQPLAVDREEAVKWNIRQNDYLHDICFVGNLYEESLYDDYVQTLPEILREYFDSIFAEAAFRWDGINRIYGKTGKAVLEYIKMACPGFRLINPWDIDDVQYFEAFYLSRKLANIERISILNLLAQKYKVALYTGSKKDTQKLQGVQIYPFADSRTMAPRIFNSSKINLNITLHSIENGTTQRVMDVMEAGGFVLSTYRPETAELFKEDKEIVMFRSSEELVEKIEYYLEHDEVRQRIAAAGHEKVLRCYTYDIKMKAFLEWTNSK